MTDIRVTQVFIEEFAAPIPPNMQTTQCVLEMWAAVATVNTRMVVTMMAEEMWASVALAGGAQQARVMVMA